MSDHLLILTLVKSNVPERLVWSKFFVFLYAKNEIIIFSFFYSKLLYHFYQICI